MAMCRESGCSLWITNNWLTRTSADIMKREKRRLVRILSLAFQCVLGASNGGDCGSHSSLPMLQPSHPDIILHTGRSYHKLLHLQHTPWSEGINKDSWAIVLIANSLPSKPVKRPGVFVRVMNIPEYSDNCVYVVLTPAGPLFRAIMADCARKHATVRLKSVHGTGSVALSVGALVQA
jgi:hypothetical protein